MRPTKRSAGQLFGSVHLMSSTEFAVSLDTYFRWEIVFVGCGRPKTAMRHCEKH